MQSAVAKPASRPRAPAPAAGERRPSLFQRLLAIYAVVLALAVAALVLGPVTVSSPIRVGELAVIVVGAVVMLAALYVLLRRALASLQRLAEVMQQVDPLAPGQRVALNGADREVAALAAAFNDMLDRLEGERRDSGRRSLAAQEDERRRIARELHDEIGQLLTGLLLRSETLARRVPVALRADVEELREASRQAAEEVRVIARRLRPEALDELGLQSALLALCTAVEARADLRVERDLERELPLTEEEELVIYRVAQEALTNVTRHAGARNVLVQLRQSGDDVTLVVRDDGRGLPAGAERASTGIRGMRERALLVGARLELRRVLPHGTEVRLRLTRRESA